MDRDPPAQRPERIMREAAALILGVPGRTVTLLARRGEIPSAAMIGRSWTFNGERLRAWIRAKGEDTTTAGLSVKRYAAICRAPGSDIAARQTQDDQAYRDTIAGLLRRPKDEP